MATKNNKNSNQPAEKKMTRYDLKMQRRHQQEVREKRISMITKWGAAVVAAIIVIVIGVSIYNSYADKHGEYVKVGSHSIKREEYDFYYALSRTSFLNTYGSYLSYMGVDTSQDIDSQTYTQDMTFGDYFAQQAVGQMQSTYALLDKANEEGFTYDVSEELANFEADLNAAASENNVSADTYLTQLYGDEATLDHIKTYYSNYVVSTMFQNHISESFDITDDEIDTYYEDNKDTYDLVDYRIFTVNADIPEDTTESDETSESLTDEEKAAQDAEKEAQTTAAMAEAKATADAFLAEVTDENSFIKQCAIHDSSYADASASLKEDAAKSSISPTDVADWLFDASRSEGDTTVIENASNNSYAIVYFIDRKINDAPTANFRQIVVAADTSAEDTDAASEEAKNKADDLLAQWTAGDATEDSFSALAKASSDDSYTSSNGGLRTGVSASALSTELSDWLLDSSRQKGDTTVIQNGNYYYVLYYVSAGSAKWHEDIESALRSQKLSDYMTALKKDYTVKDTRANLKYLELEKAAAETESETTSESTDESAESTDSATTDTSETTAE